MKIRAGEWLKLSMLQKWDLLIEAHYKTKATRTERVAL
jgi:hypothetical protein